MKNCEPFVLGPAFAIESMKGFSCFNSKLRSHEGPFSDQPSSVREREELTYFSSSNFSP